MSDKLFEVRVEKIHLVGKGSLRAFADVRVEPLGWVIRGFRIIQQPGQKAWVSVPQREYRDNGHRKYAQEVLMSKAHRQRVEEIILNEWEKQKGESDDSPKSS